ncbi:MAG TPA: phosphoglucosamine mutase [Actinomycetota bacterium]|nr:phosphoglucosamine mutase [Actinomycetota bacterium]
MFGTDGIRGIANRDLTPELAFDLGRAAAAVLGGDGRARFAIGRDTRGSGEMLEAALAAGICSMGGDVLRLGVTPTPAVAFLTVELGAGGGVVISASHNPAEYNGIKLFARDGTKLPDELEAEVERLLQDRPVDRPEGGGIGRIAEAPEAGDRYLAHVIDAARGSLEGMRVVVDCANGAASELAPTALRRLGAEVLPINDRPDGTNINAGCGATHPEVLAAEVRRVGADAGVAHDGDADRAIFSDADGTIVDGDHVLAAEAIAMREEGSLAGNAVVATVMANLGFRRAMEAAGIGVVETKVGDRYVLEEMRRIGASLGGEQSGHIVFLDRATTGDGLLTAVRFLSLARRRGVGLSELASVVEKYPQELLGVEAPDPGGLAADPAVIEAVRAAEASLGGSGRVLVRPSGTEPLLRIMVEAEELEQARKHAEAIADAARSAAP